MTSIGEAARQSGVAIETIRYYEREKIVPPPLRSPSGRRVYGPAEIDRLRLVRRCRDLGFGLADAQALLRLAETENAPCGEVKAIAEHHLAGVRAKIRELRRFERALAGLVGSCAGGAGTCPALDVLKGD